MATTAKPTTEGYAEAVRLLCGEETVADNAYKSVFCLKTSCTAAEASTYASPGGTKATESGFTIADADTVSSVQTTVADDTVQVDHVFTAGADATITGFCVCNDANDKVYAEACFTAGIALESAESDTLTVQMKVQHKLGS